MHRHKRDVPSPEGSLALYFRGESPVCGAYEVADKNSYVPFLASLLSIYHGHKALQQFHHFRVGEIPEHAAEEYYHRSLTLAAVVIGVEFRSHARGEEIPLLEKDARCQRGGEGGLAFLDESGGGVLD